MSTFGVLSISESLGTELEHFFAVALFRSRSSLDFGQATRLTVPTTTKKEKWSPGDDACAHTSERGRSRRQHLSDTTPAESKGRTGNARTIKLRGTTDKPRKDKKTNKNKPTLAELRQRLRFFFLLRYVPCKVSGVAIK